jgi:hypothetical protein
MADKQWVEAPEDTGRWCPTNKGEKLAGIYIEKKYKPFRGRDNWAYYLKTDNSIADSDGIAFVYGSITLNRQMKDVPENEDYELEIEFEGKKPNADPKKNATLLYKVRANITKDDPLYKKWYPEEDGESEAPPAAEMNLKDDNEAKNLINNYTEIYQADHHSQKPTAEDLIKLAETDSDIDDTMKSRVKAEVASQVKAGKIRSKGGK